MVSFSLHSFILAQNKVLSIFLFLKPQEAYKKQEKTEIIF